MPYNYAEYRIQRHPLTRRAHLAEQTGAPCIMHTRKDIRAHMSACQRRIRTRGGQVGQPESPVENVCMVSTRRDNSSRRPPRNNHVGRYYPPRNDVWDGIVAAVQEDRGVPMISCSIYIKYFERCLCDLGASVNIMPKVIYEALEYPSLSPTTKLVQLADSTIRYPEGIAEHVFV